MRSLENLPPIADALRCEGCPLAGSNYVPGVGQPNGCCGQGVFVVGEAPGEQEDKEQKPFVGKSGELVRAILDALGVEKEVYITNVVKRRPTTPDGKNRKPTRAETFKCGCHLSQELIHHRPKYVITLGSVPLDFFYGGHIPMTQAHGLTVPQRVFDHEYLLMPTFHPSYILRTGGIHSKFGDQWVTDLDEFFQKIYS